MFVFLFKHQCSIFNDFCLFLFLSRTALSRNCRHWLHWHNKKANREIFVFVHDFAMIIFLCSQLKRMPEVSMAAIFHQIFVLIKIACDFSNICPRDLFSVSFTRSLALALMSLNDFLYEMTLSSFHYDGTDPTSYFSLSDGIISFSYKQSGVAFNTQSNMVVDEAFWLLQQLKNTMNNSTNTDFFSLLSITSMNLLVLTATVLYHSVSSIISFKYDKK